MNKLNLQVLLTLWQVIVEIPYVLIQTTYYTLIVYDMMNFERTPTKFLWFYFITFFSFLYFTYFGMMTISITPNHQVAAILAGGFYTLFNLFAGFFIPRPVSFKYLQKVLIVSFIYSDKQKHYLLSLLP